MFILCIFIDLLMILDILNLWSIVLINIDLKEISKYNSLEYIYHGHQAVVFLAFFCSALSIDCYK